MTEEKCKQYIKSDGLNFCMSSVCLEKDCIYALVNKLHQTIDRLEQENKKLSFAIEKCLENAGIECDDEEQALRSLPMLGNAHHKVLVEKEELEQENKELKEICTKICYQSHGYTCRIWELKESKYKSTLEEIKHILEIHKDELEECLHNDIDGMIQNKINEVMNDN